MKDSNATLTILLPVYNDWESLFQLIQLIRKEMADTGITLRFLVVDDSSASVPAIGGENQDSIQILQLNRNVGHQRAIAIGLSFLNKNYPGQGNVVVMDADGEDEPAGVKILCQYAEKFPGNIIFASRKSRQESAFFKLNYFIYKLIFKLLTGKRISYGNFSFIPGNLVSKVVHSSEIWSHFSGGITRSKIPFDKVPVSRGKRLAGKSRMDFVSLILHGMSSIAVYLDIVAVRLLMTFILMLILAGAGILIVLYLKIFTSMAIPGWATSAISGLTLIFMQALLISLFLSFIVLNYRAQRPVIPALDFEDYLQKNNQPKSW